MATTASVTVRLGMDTAEFTTKLKSAEREAARWTKSLEDTLMSRRFGADEMRLARLAQSGVGAKERERIRELTELNALYKDADAPIQQATRSMDRMTTSVEKQAWSMRSLNQMMRLVYGGGALAVVSLILNKVEALGTSFKESALGMEAGTKSAYDIEAAFARSIPIIGSLIGLVSDLGEGFAALDRMAMKAETRGGWAGQAAAIDAVVEARNRVADAQDFIDAGLKTPEERATDKLRGSYSDIRRGLVGALAATGDKDALARIHEQIAALDESYRIQLKAAKLAEDREFTERSISDEKERQKKYDEETDRIIDDIVAKEKERERLYQQDWDWAGKIMKEWQDMFADAAALDESYRIQLKAYHDALQGGRTPGQVGAVLSGTQGAFSALARQQVAGIADEARKKWQEQIKQIQEETRTASKTTAVNTTEMNRKFTGVADI